MNSNNNDWFESFVCTRVIVLSEIARRCIFTGNVGSNTRISLPAMFIILALPVIRLVRFSTQVCVTALPSFIVIILFTSYPAYALDDVELDYDSIAIASGYPMPTAVAPATTSVVTSEEIEAFGYRSIGEVLSHVPGFHIGTFGIGDIKLFSVRGFTSIYTILFLVNGEPYSSSFVGSIEQGISRIPVSMIDRIEIQRGPGTSIYGSNATVGVVNIITRGDKNSNTIRLTGGSLDSKQLTVTGGTVVGDTTINVGIDAFQTDGHESFIQADIQTFLDLQQGLDPGASLAPGSIQFKEDGLGLNLELIHDKHRLMFRGYRAEDLNIAAGLQSIIDDRGLLTTGGYSLNYEFPITETTNHELSGRLSLKQNLFTLDNAQYFPPGAFGVFDNGIVSSADIRENFYSISAVDKFSFGRNHFIRMEARVEHSTYEITDFEANYAVNELGFVPDPVGNNAAEGLESDRTDLSFRINDDWVINRQFNLSYGLSVDKYGDIGNYVTPRAALIWNPNFETTFKLIAGKGIRTPVFFETVGFGVPLVVPNPDLEPEQLTSLDFVTEIRPTRKLTLRSNIFWHDTEDQINQTDNGAGGFAPVNVGTQEGRGIELETAYSHSEKKHFRIWAHYQENEGAFLPGSPVEEIGFSPHVKAGINYRYKHGPLKYGLAFVYTGDRDRAPNSQLDDADTYSVVNLSVSYAGKFGISYRLKVENLFDEEAKEQNFIGSAPFDYEIPPRKFLFSLEKKF